MPRGSVPREFSIAKARQVQTNLAKKVVTEDRLPKRIRLIGGVDVAYHDDWAVGAFVVLDYESLELLEVKTCQRRVNFPYVPTLLSFRELPAIISCVQKARLKPDVLLVDAHGRAHPYRLGFASHLGVVLGMPTVGVAKSRLVGEIKQVGEHIFLELDGEVVGEETKTREGNKPVYVSIGNMVSLQTAVEIVKHCSSRSRVPEPIRQAHQAASKRMAEKLKASSSQSAVGDKDGIRKD